MSKKKVVVIGGGNGSAFSIVALKQNLDRFDFSAAIAVSDSGGSSGRLREEFNVLPPGDIMRAVLACSKYDYILLKKIFYTNRFENAKKLNGHNLGNLFFAFGSKYEKDFQNIINVFGQSIEAVGKVFPATLSRCDLRAELSNGKILKHEHVIDRPKYNRSWKIKKVWLFPQVKANPSVVAEILKADYIILSPGSLYTSVVAALLPFGIKSAIEKSKAKIVFISGDAYRVDGETGPETLSETISQLERYLPRKCDYVLYNNHQLNTAEKKHYKQKKWAQIKDDGKNIKGRKIMFFDFSRDGGGLCAFKLGEKFKEILK